MKTCVVIVTYGDRWKCLRIVLIRLKEMNCKIIIVIENDTVPRLVEEKFEGVRFVYSAFNLGSAGGYKKGLKLAYKSDCDFIWLLDDDNTPDLNALDILLSYYESFKAKGEKDFCLCMERGRLRNSNIGSFIGSINFPFLKPKKITETINEVVYKVPACTYGGMFFHKSLLDKIGYPKEKWFLYVDDYEFSYRITQQGMNIYLITDAKIEEVETKEKELEIKKEDYSRLYYKTRNLVYFKKQLTNNKLLFWVGSIALKTYYRLKYKGKKKQTLIKAVKNGMK